ncbi:MAG: FISUMP domain-containing protein [Bacteroidales bacterium]
MNKTSKHLTFSHLGVLWLSFCFFLFLSSNSNGEGTKQILQSEAGHGKIQVYPGFSTFAYYTNAGVSATVDYRLHIHIEPGGEKIYYGFGDPLNSGDAVKSDVLYRIIDPLGNIVVGGVAGASVPMAGAGHINSLIEAQNGPSSITAGGYSALTYIPLLTGDYFIEFNFPVGIGNDDRRKFKYFDVTVASPSNQEIVGGRLWSKAWQLTADANGLAFNGTFFIYSNDGVVTSVNSNGMAPFVFTIACNQYGCYNSGNFINDRRSVSGNHIVPQYKIFLKNPDDVVYPTGIPGEIIPPIIVTAHCDGSADIEIYVTKDGNVDILLDINPAAGQQAEDVQLSGPVLAGQPNVFHWSGLNGQGQMVVNNSTFNIVVTYVNGLTNLPISDIDENPNGFIIDLLRPAGPVPPVFWDDHLVNGTMNTSPGCTYTLPSTGCHTVTLTVGNNNTINTWWYAVTSVPYPVNYIHKRTALLPTFQQPSQTLCANSTSGTIYVDIEPNTSVYHWNYTGTGVTINQINPGDNFVTLTLSPTATSGFLQVYGTNDNCPTPGPTAQVPVTVNPVPDVVASPAGSLTICNNTTAIVGLSSTVPGTINNTTFNWSALAFHPLNVVPPSPSGSSLTQISQAFSNLGNSVEDILVGIVPVSNGCTGLQVSYLINVNPTPGVIFVSPATPAEICSGTAADPITLSTNVIPAAGMGYEWTVTCNPLNISNCPQNGSAILVPEIPAANPVNLTGQVQDIVYDVMAVMNASGNQLCYGPPSDFTIHVNPKPALGNLTLSQHTCSGVQGDAVQLEPSPLPPANVSFNWTAAPSSPLVTNYTPSGTNTMTIPAETILNPTTSIQHVYYSITPVLNGGSSCTGDMVVYTIDVDPMPDVLFTSSTPSICSGSQADVYFSTSIASLTTYAWSVGLPLPTGVTISNTTGSGDFHETITNTGSTPATIRIDVIPTSLELCTPAVPYSYSIIVNPLPLPVMTAVPATPTPCGNSQVTYSLLGAPLANHTYQWSISGGNPISGTNSSINITWGNSNIFPGNLVNVMESVNYGAGVVCSNSTSSTITLNLIPDAAGTISGPADACLSQSKHYNVSPIANSDSYTWWYVPPAGVAIVNNGTNADLTFSLTSSSGNLYVKGNKTGCSSGSASPALAITVHTPPPVTLSSCNDAITTTSSRPFILKGGVPAGGQYYIDGNLAIGGVFNPAVLTPANHLVTYSYTDVNTCVNTTTPIQIKVNTGSNLLTCPGSFKDVRDQQQYSAFTLGGQCWMLSNLNYPLQKTSDIQPQRDNCLPEKYCAPTDATCSGYGGLYQWDELMQYQVPATGATQGLCPPEWHIPTSAEWQALINANQGNGIAAGSLKNPIPVSGFHAILNGLNYLNSTWAFTDANNMKATMFWTSTLVSGKPVSRGLNTPNPSVSYYESSKANAFPVRCIKD